MGAILKNVLLTGLMVIVTTIASSVIGAVSMLVIGSVSDEMPADAGIVAFGIVVMGILAAVFGVFFSVATLFFAALTMPPVLLVTDRLKLSRPAMDIIGGGIVGLLCAMAAIDVLDSDKTASLVAGENAQIMAVTGLVMGCLLGYVRHALLVRRRGEPVVPQFAAQG